METFKDMLNLLRYFYGKRWERLTKEERRRIVYYEFDDDI